MKKLFLGAAIAMSTLSFAQTFGVKGGLNLSTISNSDNAFETGETDVDSKSKAGFNAGVFVNIPVGESFSVQPEVLYNALGTKITGDDEEGNDNALTLNLDYISVPVMFQYNVVPQFYLEAGPQFSFLVNSKLKLNDKEQDLNDDSFNSFDFGVGLGAGFNITPQLGVNARYVAGFTDVIKDNPTDDKFKNNAFQVGLTFKFAK